MTHAATGTGGAAGAGTHAARRGWVVLTHADPLQPRRRAGRDTPRRARRRRWRRPRCRGRRRARCAGWFCPPAQGTAWACRPSSATRRRPPAAPPPHWRRARSPLSGVRARPQPAARRRRARAGAARARPASGRRAAVWPLPGRRGRRVGAPKTPARRPRALRAALPSSCWQMVGRRP